MKSTIMKSTLASMALFASLSASAQISTYTYGQDNPFMVFQKDVQAIPSNPYVAAVDTINYYSDSGDIDSTNFVHYVPTFQFNIYYGGDYSDDDYMGLLICDNVPDGKYDFVEREKIVELSNATNYITKSDSTIYCEIRSCYYDSIAEKIVPVAERKAISTPVIVRGVQFGDSIYCYDGLRFRAHDLESIDEEPSLWLTSYNGTKTEYHICDNSTSTYPNTPGMIFEGFEHNGKVYEINGTNDYYGIEITPIHNVFDLKKIETTQYIPLEYGTGKKIKLADGSKIKIIPLKQGKYTIDGYDINRENHYVLYIYPLDEEGYEYEPTILGNITKTENGFDLSKAGFIYHEHSAFDTENIITENGKLNGNAYIGEMNGRCVHYFSWCTNHPFILEDVTSMSIGLNNLSHYSNFTSTSIGFCHGMSTISDLFEKNHD